MWGSCFAKLVSIRKYRVGVGGETGERKLAAVHRTILPPTTTLRIELQWFLWLASSPKPPFTKYHPTFPRIPHGNSPSHLVLPLECPSLYPRSNYRLRKKASKKKKENRVFLLLTLIFFLHHPTDDFCKLNKFYQWKVMQVKALWHSREFNCGIS